VLLLWNETRMSPRKMRLKPGVELTEKLTTTTWCYQLSASFEGPNAFQIPLTRPRMLHFCTRSVVCKPLHTWCAALHSTLSAFVLQLVSRPTKLHFQVEPSCNPTPQVRGALAHVAGLYCPTRRVHSLMFDFSFRCLSRHANYLPCFFITFFSILPFHLCTSSSRHLPVTHAAILQH
jgi:hypothetical protein